MLPTFDNPLRRLIHNPYRILGGLVHPGQTVVDLGCGMGYFSIPLARMVGPKGKVICIDVQQQMLDGLRRRATRAGVLSQVTLHRCEPTQLGLAEPADFVLAFWMLHEVPDQTAFLAGLAKADDVLRAQQTTYFDNLRQLPLATFAYSVDPAGIVSICAVSAT